MLASVIWLHSLANEGRRRRDVQFIDIGVEDAVHKADAGRLVRVLIGQFDMDLPVTARERGCGY